MASADVSDSVSYFKIKNEFQKDETDVLFSIYPDRIRIVNDGNNDSLPVLQISVSLKFTECEDSRLKIDIWLDQDGNKSVEEEVGQQGFAAKSSDVVEKPTVPVVSENLPVSIRPSFERTVSGKRLHSTYFSPNLPRLDIFIVLSNDYPKRSSPNFTLSSVYLSNAQLNCICQRLDALWLENINSPIIFIWLDWLENECLNFLGVSSIVLASQNDFSIDVDDRILNTDLTVTDRLLEIFKNDMQIEEKLFAASMQTCPVCFDVKRGVEFCRLDQCWHYFCSECVQAYIQLHVQQGTIQFLTCPEEKCQSPIPVHLVKRFLTNDQWQRYESLSLSKAIENFENLDWCPRCQMPCERERDHATSFLARCVYCSFSFCTSCRESWHQGVQCETLEDKLTDLEKLTLQTLNLDVRESVQMRMSEIKRNILSMIKLKQTTKPCPGCLVPIEKNMGCNHVVCTNCRTEMCWLCGQKIRGYNHFNGGVCTTTAFEDEDGARYRRPPPVINEKQVEMIAILDMNPTMRKRLIKCPFCRADNLKMFNNNHIRCWACNNSHCYACRKKFTGTTTKGHYGLTKNKCLQHSDD